MPEAYIRQKHWSYCFVLLCCVVSLPNFWFQWPVWKGDTTSRCAKGHRVTLCKNCLQSCRGATPHRRLDWGQTTTAEGLVWVSMAGHSDTGNLQERKQRSSLSFKYSPMGLLHCASTFDKEKILVPTFFHSPLGRTLTHFLWTDSVTAANIKLTTAAGHKLF